MKNEGYWTIYSDFTQSCFLLPHHRFNSALTSPPSEQFWRGESTVSSEDSTTTSVSSLHVNWEIIVFTVVVKC